MVDQPTYRELKNDLLEYCHLYYGKGESPIPDEEYDIKYLELIQMEKAQGWKDSDSPTQRVGYSVEGIKIKHKEFMPSLDNVFNGAELFHFFSGYTEEQFVLEGKVDGIAGALIYNKNGQLVSALTRGDGEYGEDIFNKVVLIDSVPKTIDAKDESIEIRGEFCILRNDFDAINQERTDKGLNPYKNRRNATSGTFASKDHEDVIRNKIVFIAYNTVNWSDIPLHLQLAKIQSLGFIVVRQWLFFNLAELEESLEPFWNTRETEFPYDVDGLVIKLDNPLAIRTLGFTAKFPKWAVARKWNTNIVFSFIKDIIAQVGRTGAITPVAIIEPIDINGVTVERATLHNFNECARLGIGIGARINIVRSGEVIPKILSVVHSDVKIEPIAVPSECPVCHSELMYMKEDDAILYCSNNACKGILRARIEHFCSRLGMDIEGLSEKTIEKLVDKGYLETLDDVYHLNKEKLLTIEGFADLSCQNLLTAIEKSKTPQLERFIYGLGIPDVGIKTAKIIAQHYGDMALFMNATLFDLQSLRGIGAITARNIIQYIESQYGDEIRRLLKIVKPIFNQTVISKALATKVFCITGSMSVSRDQLEAFLEKHSATVTGSVSRKTTLLLVGQEPGDSKLQAAIKYNVPMLEVGDESLNRIAKGIEDLLGVVLRDVPF